MSVWGRLKGSIKKNLLENLSINESVNLWSSNIQLTFGLKILKERSIKIRAYQAEI